MILACQQTNGVVSIVENATKYLARQRRQSYSYLSRLEVEVFAAYSGKTRDSRADLCNGSLEIQLVEMKILRTPEEHKRTYEFIPGERTLPSAAWAGVPSGCSTPGENTYRKELKSIDGIHAGFLRRLRHKICQPYRDEEEQTRFRINTSYVITNQHVTEENRCMEC